MTKKSFFAAVNTRCVAIAGVVLLFKAGLAAAQAAPGADISQIFQNLTPEQQQAILDRAGGANSANGTSATSGTTDRRGQNAEREARRPVKEATEPLIPVLRADDTVVIELSFPRQQSDVPATVQLPVQPAAPSQVQSPPKQVTASEEAALLRRQRMVAALNPDDRKKLEDLITLVQQRNPYVLDRTARLALPGFAPIALGGLTEEQATQRLSVEPVLLPLEVHVTQLPLTKTGIGALKPFGYDLFNEAPSTFSPITDVPVPADYVMGPGDQLRVQLFGSQNRSLSLTVTRDGTVMFPELGPIQVGGLTFNATRRAIESQVARQMIGVRASVSVADTRSIRVLVLGEARQPGSYTVSGLATMTAALFASGGVTPIGSLRDVQLKRQGKVVRRFDLYDLLIRGDTSDDAKLLPGDVIFVPPVGATVSVDGEVKRPAIYELRGESSVADVLEMAGGLTPEADTTRGSLVHIDENNRRVVLEVNLKQPGDRARALRNGDELRMARLRPQLDSGVTLEGFVYRPGFVAWREGLRLSGVIASVDELKPNADQHYILVRREIGPNRRISVVSADLTAALAAPGSAADILLSPRDRITVFDLAPGRERIIEPLMQELRLQSGLSNPTEIVRVGGMVKVPGEYPLEPGMRVGDLLRAGGNLQAAAYGGKADLARYTVSAAGARQTELIEIDLAALRSGDAAANIALQPYDYLLVKETTDWSEQESVTLKGEVRFPGIYPIGRGETLRQLLERAGGLSSQAFPEGAAFTRLQLKESEQRQLDQLRERLGADLAALSLQAAAANQPGASQALASSQSLLTQLQGSKAVGRMVIDMRGLLSEPAHGAKDIDLRDGDVLVVPKLRQEVTVIGEVNSATSHLFTAGLKRDDYIAKSGGATRRADTRNIYVVHADGSVVAQRSSLFSRNYEAVMRPGDTIVVPINTERMPRLPFWQAVTQIVYNLAVSVAAINSF